MDQRHLFNEAGDLAIAITDVLCEDGKLRTAYLAQDVAPPLDFFARSYFIYMELGGETVRGYITSVGLGILTFIAVYNTRSGITKKYEYYFAEWSLDKSHIYICAWERGGGSFLVPVMGSLRALDGALVERTEYTQMPTFEKFTAYVTHKKEDERKNGTKV